MRFVQKPALWHIYFVDFSAPDCYTVTDMSDSSICAKIADELLEIIEHNRDVPDYRLPAKRALAQKFNCSRMPVENAYKALAGRGYVRAVHGKGYFIAAGFKGKPAVRKNICFIAPSVWSVHSRSILKGLQAFCKKNMLNLYIVLTDNVKGQESAEKTPLAGLNCNGLIVWPDHNERHSRELRDMAAHRFPIVTVDSGFRGLGVSHVSTNHYQMMLDAVGFLQGKGHKNISFICIPALWSTSVEERAAGFTDGLLRFFGNIREGAVLRIENVFSDEGFISDITRHLLEYPDTDVLITTDCQVKLALQAAAEAGIPVPQKLRMAVIDIEMSDVETAFVRPYAIQQDSYEIGYRAGAILYGQLYGERRVVSERLPAKIFESLP